MNVDTAKNYSLRECLQLKEAGEKLLVLDTASYSVHELNESAAIVAQLCDGRTSCAQMVAAIASRFDSDPKHAAEVVYRGLQLLQDQELLESA